MKPTLAILLLLCFSGLAQAGQHEGRNMLSREEAANRVQHHYGGRVLDIRRKDNGQYRIKLLKDGRIRIINFDSRSHREKN